MASGGSRNRSGPPLDEMSGRSDRRGVVLTALPAEGYDGEVPEFPLSRVRIYDEYFADGERVRELDEGSTQARRDRELELWDWAWSTPQAAAWSVQPWRWHAVAMWVRTAALCESSDATAADKNSLHRFADQIGLTPAGLKENGWKIATDELSQKRSAAADPVEGNEDDPRARFAVVSNGGA